MLSNLIKIVVLLYVFTTIVSQCETSDKPNYQIISFGECIGYYFLESGENIDSKKEVVIRNNREYKNFQDYHNKITPKTNNYSCVYPKIDFKKFDLIGKYTPSKGCDNEVTYKVYLENNLEKYICDINIDSRKKCESTSFFMNYLLISKIPLNYKLEFHVNYN